MHGSEVKIGRLSESQSNPVEDHQVNAEEMRSEPCNTVDSGGISKSGVLKEGKKIGRLGHLNRRLHSEVMPCGSSTGKEAGEIADGYGE